MRRLTGNHITMEGKKTHRAQGEWPYQMMTPTHEIYSSKEAMWMAMATPYPLVENGDL